MFRFQFTKRFLTKLLSTKLYLINYRINYVLSTITNFKVNRIEYHLTTSDLKLYT